MAATLANLRYWTQYLVGDPQTNSFSSQHYIDAANFAIKQYCHKTGVSYTESSVSVDASGLVVIPVSYMKINRVLYGTTELVESDFKFESMASPTWQTTTSASGPKRWVLWSGAKIKLTPILATWPGTCTVGFTDAPTSLAVDTDTIDARIPPAHNEYLKYAAATWLLNLDGDTNDVDTATQFMNIFNQLIGYSDPVLTAKINVTRKEGKLEV